MRKAGFRLSRVRNVLSLCGIVLIVGVVAFNAVMNSMGNDDANASNGGSAYDARPVQMEKLDYVSVFTGSLVDNTVDSSQSLAITDKYFVVVQANGSQENAGWIVATSLTSPNSTPAWKVSYNIGHGNGATWTNNWTDEIVITNGSTRFFFDADDGTFNGSRTVSTTAWGIAYDDGIAGGGYVELNGKTGRFVGMNFESIGSDTFDTTMPLVAQDVAYYNGDIYVIGWGGCNYLEHDQNSSAEAVAICRNEFGEGSDAIYQFDGSGNYVKGYYLEANAGELESMAFDASGTPYLLFNGGSQYTISRVNTTLGGGGSNQKESQKITFSNNPNNIVNGSGGNYTVVAGASCSGATIIYSSNNSNVAVIDAFSGALTIKGVGTTRITATAAETTNCYAGSNYYDLTVLDSSNPGTDPSDPGGGSGKQKQHITFEKQPKNITYGSTGNHAVLAVTDGDGEIKYSSSVSSVASIDESNGALTINGVGSTIITVRATETENYKQAISAYTLTVTGSSDPGTDPSDPGTDPSDPDTDPSDPGTDPSDPGTDPSDPGDNPNQKLSQAIAFTVAPYKITYGSDENYTVTATTTGNGAITYTSSNSSVATINRTTGVLTIKGVGTTTITATAAETATHNKSSRSYTLTVVAQSDPDDDPSDPSDDPSDPGDDPSDPGYNSDLPDDNPNQSGDKSDSSKDSQNQTGGKTSGGVVVPNTGENMKDGGMTMDVIIAVPVLLIAGVGFGLVVLKRVKIDHRKFD